MMVTLTPGTVLLLLIFLSLLYFALMLLTDASSMFQRSVDLVAFGVMFVLCLMYIQTDLSFEDIARKEVFRPVLSGILKQLDSTGSLWTFAAVLGVLYATTWLTGMPSLASMPVTFGILANIAWLGVVLCGANELTKLAFHYSLFKSLNNLLWYGSTDPEEELRKQAAEREKKRQYGEDGNEVFHVGNQLYSFAEADEICRIKGGKLATRAQLEEAHAHGADWLGSYGWSTNQEAYTISPTDGVQGGRVTDPSILLGVNCYGRKPEMTDRDRMLLNKLRAEAKGVDVMSQIKLLFAQLNPELFATTRPFSGDQWKAFHCQLKSDLLNDNVVKTPLTNNNNETS